MIVGLNADESVQTGIRSSIKLRMPWLLLNLATVCAAAVVGLFESTVAKAALLAAFCDCRWTGRQCHYSDSDDSRAQHRTGRYDTAERATCSGQGNRSWRRAWSGTRNHRFRRGVYVVAGRVAVSRAGYRHDRQHGCCGGGGSAYSADPAQFGVDPALAAGIFGTTVTDIVGFGVLLGLAAISISVLGL